tara:strand:- start:434 stop:628 length:195 start_codon:yes stop_codon:yes gene_type:complete
MRNRERAILEEVADKIHVASDLVATILEGREAFEEEGGVSFDLRMLYSGLIGMIDDIDEISYEL